MTAWVVSARRSAVVPQGGAFRRLSIEDLGAPVMLACLADAGLGPDQVDEVIVSNALGAGGNPARRLALAAGLPERIAGLSIDRQCAGGLDAILIARAMVISGAAEAVLAGGVESWSRRPLRLTTDPDGGAPVPYEAAPFTPWPERDPDMTVAADVLATRLGISRVQQEAWAVESHRKAMANPPAGIVPILDVARDPFARTLTERVAARAPSLSGSITSSTTAVAADAAAFCLVVSDRLARTLHAARLPPLSLLSGATLGANPEEPGTAPLAAIAESLSRAALVPGDISQAEVMEAYAVQAIACVQGAGLDPAFVNPQGGALARGHPIGASGAILAVNLFHGLASGHGLAAIAAAGGIGTALIVSRLP